MSATARPTAMKLGASPLTLDWTGLGRVAELDVAAATAAWQTVHARFDSGEVGFYDAPLPEKDTVSQAAASQALADSLLKGGRFTDCLFLGIGGSSLGPISLLGALHERCTSGLRFHFQENPDPVDWRSTLSKLKPDSTLVCAVTKSGTTFETMAQTLLALEWLGKERWKTHFVGLTDPEKGDLRQFVNREGLQSLVIAPSIGGRFSIFSPVGLFPAALSGLSCTELLAGAKGVRDHLEKAAPEKNPIFIIGSELLRGFSKRPIHVCMPYSTRLKSIAAWFVQLWAESLGKDGKGFTPLAAVGATDQHSILQLLRDGPDDKVTLFVTVGEMGEPVKIPRAPTSVAGLEAFKRLGGHSLEELLQVEYRATSLVLSKRARPHLTWQIDRLDERSLGALYFAFSALTAFTGTLWGVNPFDQPGVEEGKVYTRNSLDAPQGEP